MSHDLPEDWYKDHEGQSLVLNPEKVAAEIERLSTQVADLTVQLRDARNTAWSSERESRRYTLRTAALHAEIAALHAALDAALFSLCTDDYEAQQAVAAELKVITQQQASATEEGK